MQADAYDALEHRRAFGDRVRSLREAKGWTQERLAEESGLHRTYVTSVERGHRNVSLDAIYSLAEGLSVQVARLFDSGPT